MKLTSSKPVNFVWLERKIMEWGCMQALIDFDGWRKWKDFSSNQSSNQQNEDKPEKKSLAKKKKGNRVSVGSNGAAGASRLSIKEEGGEGEGGGT
jgi:osomolarity two-component system response regulator SSK1